MDRPVRVPEALRRKARVEGAECELWLAELDELLNELEREWSITIRANYAGGTASFVAEAETADGSPAVIKLAMPAELDGRQALENEVRTLLLVRGRGCVRVLNHDAARGAVLLERLGRQLANLGWPVRAQLEVICATLARVWASPTDPELPSGAAKGRWLAQSISRMWEQLDRPCPAWVAEQAVVFAERRVDAFDAERGVLVHGDAHAFNTLEDVSSPGAFKFVDPDGLVAEKEYDLAILMREFTEELLAGDALRIGRERARFLADLTGLDEQRIWEWGVVERVATGLLLLKLGNAVVGKGFLRVAEHWAAG